MTAHLIAAIVLIASVAALFGVAAEIARLTARRRVDRGLTPGMNTRDIGEIYRHATPLFRLSRELAAVSALLFAAAAGVLAALATGAP